jgi:hypothetical protein
MDEPRQIKPLIAALQHEMTGALSRQRVARMQELAQQLTEALTVIGEALAGGASYHGDLWPTEEDVDEEEHMMDQEQVLLLIDALDKAGVVPGARRDAIARAAQHFGPHAVQDWEARDFAQQLHRDAPHFFRQPATGPAPTTTGTTGYRPGKRKELPQPPRSVSAPWDALPPMQRLARLREWQAAQQPSS